MKIVIVLLSLVVVLLLFLPTVYLASALFFGGFESAFINALGVITLVAFLSGAIARRFRVRVQSTKHIGVFIFVSLILATLVCLLDFYVIDYFTRRITEFSITDSSHGSSIVVLVSGCLGSVFAAALWLAIKANRAQIGHG